MTAPEQESEEIGAELVPFQHTRTVDLRNATTDSWTDVLNEVADLANKISGSDFVPETYRGKTAQVAAAILHGRELGLPPLTALAMTNPIKGKPTISAEAMRALALQAGHEIVVTESSTSRVVIKGRRRGSEDWTSVSWTLEDARLAGLLRKSQSGSPTNWDRFPRQMLLARASTELCRIAFPDVIHGMRSAEEMIDEIDQVTELQAETPPMKTTTVQRKRAAKKPTQTGEPGRTAGADDPAPLTQPPARKRVDLPAPKTAPANDARDSDEPSQIPQPDPSPEQQQEEIRHLSEERRNLQTDRQESADPNAARAEETPAGDDHDADQDNDVIDAEIVTGRDSGPKISAAQRAAVIMHFKRLDVDDRDERLLITNILLGFEPGTVDTSSNLRGGEPQRLLAILETLKDRDALDARLNGQDQLT